MSPSDPPPEFFIDRSLGRKHLATALAARGLIVHTMASVYGEDRAQELADEEWLADAGARGWVVLMKDAAIRRRPAERDALAAAGVRTFCLTNANLRAAEQTQRFLDHLAAMIEELAQPGPWICGVYADGLRRIWP